MRLTQMLAVLNGEVPYYDYHRLSHYDPDLCWGDSKEREQMDRDEADRQALVEILNRMNH